jgi:hypothetical protein
MRFGGVEGVRRNSEEGPCPICSREKDWNHMLKCEGENIWRDNISDKRFTLPIQWTLCCALAT